MHNLLSHPLWRSDDLGSPLPDSFHACSMALPCWDHVVGYEEGAPEVHDRLACGYPRFVFHPVVRSLMAVAHDHCGKPGTSTLVFPSLRTARACADYVAKKSGAVARIVDLTLDGVFAVDMPRSAASFGRAFWQHTGLIVSSRRAASVLARRQENRRQGAEARRLLRERLAALYGTAPDDVFLFPSGMAATHAAHETIQSLRPGTPRIQLEFPYLDTLKVQQELGESPLLLTEATSAQVLAKTKGQGLGAILTETPSNPLLRTADIRQAAAIAHEQGALLVVDDTIATPINVDVTPWADIVVTSLSKSFCGFGDVMAGALITNPRSSFHADIKAVVQEGHEDLLWGEDAVVLEERSRNFAERVLRMSRTAHRLVQFLRDQPAIEAVFYPDHDPEGTYEGIRLENGKWGFLFSILLKDASRTAPAFYDSLRVTKGPSLGTDFTLACPYTLIAHYRELDWAEQHGVSRWLIRVSVGLEEADDLITRFQQAIQETSILCEYNPAL